MEPTESKFFDEFSRKKYNTSFINYEKIEKELETLKTTGFLEYKHLKMIEDSWSSFSTWYRWPAESQIGEDLENAQISFISLNGYKNDNKSYKVEIEFFNKLFAILKNIELVSIILRFIDPTNFGMYSPPVAHYLKSARGIDYKDEYINYLKKIHEIMKHTDHKKVAYFEMYAWFISKINQCNYKSNSLTAIKNLEDVIKLFKYKKNEDIFSKVFSSKIEGKNDIEQAKFFSKSYAYNLAAYCAGKAFENIINEKCKSYRIETDYISLDISINNLVEKVGKYYYSQTLHKVRKLRNRSVHEDYTFEESDIEFMINTIEQVETW